MLESKALKFNSLYLRMDGKRRKNGARGYYSESNSTKGRKGLCEQTRVTPIYRVKLYTRIFAPVQLIAPGSGAKTIKELRNLNKVIKHLMNTADAGLSFVPMYLVSTVLVLFSDVSFANSRNILKVIFVSFRACLMLTIMPISFILARVDVVVLHAR